MYVGSNVTHNEHYRRSDGRWVDDNNITRGKILGNTLTVMYSNMVQIGILKDYRVVEHETRTNTHTHKYIFSI